MDNLILIYLSFSILSALPAFFVFLFPKTWKTLIDLNQFLFGMIRVDFYTLEFSDK